MIGLFSLQRVIFSHECSYNLKYVQINYMMGLRIWKDQCYQIAFHFLINQSFNSCIIIGCFFLFVAQPKVCFMEEGIAIRSAEKYTELTCLLDIMNQQFLRMLLEERWKHHLPSSGFKLSLRLKSGVLNMQCALSSLSAHHFDL